MAVTYGSKGDDVLQYQKKLAAAGFNPGPLDGIYGDKTKAADTAYQASMTQATNSIAKPAGADPLAGLVGLRSTAERMGGIVGWDPKTGPSVNGAKIDTTGMKYQNGSWYGNQDSIMNQLATTKAPEYQAGGGMFKQEDLQGLVDKILNPQAFQFDASNPMIASMMGQAEKSGEKAFNNNLADLTAATGGRLNSWAAGQASQARSSAVEDIMPQLYEMAYGMWGDEQNRNASALSSLMGIDETMYNRSRDAYGDFRDNVGTGLDLANQQYERGADTRDYNRDVMESDRTFNRGNLESDRNYALNVSQERRIASGSTATDKSIASMGTPDQVAEYYDTLKRFGNGGKSPSDLYTAASTTLRGDLVTIMGEDLADQLLSDLEGMDKVVGQTKPETEADFIVSKDPIAQRASAMMEEMMQTSDPTSTFGAVVDKARYTPKQIAEYVMNNVEDDEKLAAILNYLGIPETVFNGPQQNDGSVPIYKK